jgi:quercetin dioxygenase-like cupin family protein
MFYKSDPNGYKKVLDGIHLKALVHGERTLLAAFRLKKGSHLPRHAHPHEQTGYLVSGRMRLHVGDDRFEASAGDSWCIGRNVEHGADIIEDSVAIEVFSPVREDYLPAERG